MCQAIQMTLPVANMYGLSKPGPSVSWLSMPVWMYDEYPPELPEEPDTAVAPPEEPPEEPPDDPPLLPLWRAALRATLRA